MSGGDPLDSGPSFGEAARGAFPFTLGTTVLGGTSLSLASKLLTGAWLKPLEVGLVGISMGLVGATVAFATAGQE